MAQVLTDVSPTAPAAGLAHSTCNAVSIRSFLASVNRFCIDARNLALNCEVKSTYTIRGKWTVRDVPTVDIQSPAIGRLVMRRR